jgi:5-(carboxyamino)imidazole ribonucleotide synthase
VMVNLLGRREGPVSDAALVEALAVPGAHLHLYGKREGRVGRKLGHITALGPSLGAAEAVARHAAELVMI